MFIKNNIVNKINKFNIINTALYFLYSVLIIFSVSRYIVYNYEHFLYTGDFRIHSQIVDENTANLFNYRLMSETTPYVSLSPILSIFRNFNINFIFFFIIYLIPLLSFNTMSFVVFKYIKIDNKKLKYITTFTLSFIYIINPSYFNRIGHWNINYLYIFIPLFYYYVDKFLDNKDNFKLLFIILPISYFGVSSPHSMVGFSGILLLLITFNFKKKYSYVLKCLSIIFVFLYSISHNLIAMLLKNNIILKTSWEGDTTANILKSLSSNSNLISSLSGTNYYYDKLIIHPTAIGVGFILFYLIIYTIYKKNKISNQDIKLLTILSIFLLINIGYNSIPYLYDHLLLKINFTKNLLWLVKDPNIFFNFLNFFLVLTFAVNINLIKDKIKIILVLIIVLNLIHIFLSNINEYKKFYKMIELPKDYANARDYLSNQRNRTLWIPNSVYIKNIYAIDITYFPNFNLWLTNNREITVSNSIYKNFIDILNYEVIDNKCKNKNFISWLLKSNQISLIIDNNSYNEQRSFYNKCIQSINTLQLSKAFNHIHIYDSNMELIKNKDILVFKGDNTELDRYLQVKPYKYITFKEFDLDTDKKQIEFIDVPYNKNLTYNNNELLGDVNFISSYYNSDNIAGGLYFKNNKIYNNYINLQLGLSVLSAFIYVIIMILNKYRKKL